MSYRKRTFGVALAVAVVGIGTLALAAPTIGPSNGDFEAGSLQGWKTKLVGQDGNPVAWYTYKKGDEPGAAAAAESGKARSQYRSGRGGQFAPGRLPDPPQGKFAAYGFGAGGGPRVLYRNLHLKPDSKIKLKMNVLYKNLAGVFISPDSLSPDADGGNQQYRIDVMPKGAPLDSVDSSDILKSVFRTEPGDPKTRLHKSVSVDLSKYAGQTVQLRLAEVDSEFYFYPGVDNVKLIQRSKH